MRYPHQKDLVDVTGSLPYSNISKRTGLKAFRFTTYTVEQTSLNDVGIYECVISTNLGTVKQRAANVTVNGKYKI